MIFENLKRIFGNLQKFWVEIGCPFYSNVPESDAPETHPVENLGCGAYDPLPTLGEIG
jgi:hypothetical protein